MGWRLVKQPNGLYARFSEIVDDFTDYDMDRQEAFETCRDLAGVNVANQKIDSADKELDDRDQPREPLYRFNDCIETIGIVHGKKEAAERRKQLSENVEEK